MSNNPVDTSLVNSRESFPLESFFAELKENGFIVTPGQIVDCYLLLDHFPDTDPVKLYEQIAPVFCTNQDEQTLFRHLYLRKQDPGIIIDPPGNRWRQLLLRSLWILVPLLAIAAYLLVMKPGCTVQVKGIHIDVPAKIKTGEVITLSLDTLWNPEKDASPVNNCPVGFREVTDWGDGIRNALRTHTYNNEGTYKISTILDAWVKEGRKDSTRFTDSVNILVCNNTDTLRLETTTGTYSFNTNQKFVIAAQVTGRAPASFRWNVNDSLLSNSSAQLGAGFSAPGSYTVQCTALQDTKEEACFPVADLTINIVDPRQPVYTGNISEAPDAVPLEAGRSIKTTVWWLLGSLCFLGLLFPLLGRRKRRQTETDFDEKHLQLLAGFNGQEPPLELPFLKNNHLTVPEQALAEIARNHQQKLAASTVFLHIRRTIIKSISKGGLLTPVYLPKKIHPEYLVLFDETNTNGQQVQLFEYLLDYLIKRNIFIERYYYRYDPAVCYHPALAPAGISLEALHNRYPNHVLLIFGNGYQFINPFSNVFQASFAKELGQWNFKAILTPVSFCDWGEKELEALLPFMPVVPADLPAQLLLFRALFDESLDLEAALSKYQREFYEAAAVNFDDIDELIAYCQQAGWANRGNTNILVQWLGAIALYPKIRWELIIATGYALFKKYREAQQLNFTNLLRLTRISWMHEGEFPDYIRLELLKELEPENEELARVAILAKLSELQDIGPSQYAYEEKEIQRITNEFNLYAYAPGKYPQYENSAGIFKRLLQEGQVMDSPTKAYLKKEGDWKTMINKQAQNVDLSTYFGLGAIGDNSTAARSRRNRNLVSYLVSLLCFIAGLLLLAFPGNKSIPHWLTVAGTDLWVNFAIQKDININDVHLLIDNQETLPVAGKADSILSAIFFSDSSHQLKLVVANTSVIDTMMRLNKSRYQIRVVQSRAADPAKQLDIPIFTNNTALFSALTLPNCKFTYLPATDRTVIADLGKRLLNNVLCIMVGAKDTLGPSLASLQAACVKAGFKPDSIVQISTEAAYQPFRLFYYAAIPGTPSLPKNVRIYISDTSLLASVTKFEKRLEAKGFNVKEISKRNFKDNSYIVYDNQLQKTRADTARSIFKSYYPLLDIQSRYLAPAQTSKNDIIFWIQKAADSVSSVREKPITLNGITLRAGVLSGRNISYQPLKTTDKALNTGPLSVVFHITVTASLQATLRVLQNTTNSNSNTGMPANTGNYHLLIDKDGSVVQFIPLNRVSNHAGSTGYNNTSISIAFINKGHFENSAQMAQQTKDPYADKENCEGNICWEPITSQQTSAASQVLQLLRQAYTIQNIFTHDQIDPKKDEFTPGPPLPSQLQGQRGK